MRALAVLLTAIGLFGFAPAQTQSQQHQSEKISSRAQSDPAAQASLVEAYGKLPLSFEANRGQLDSRVKFISRGNGYTLFLTSTEAVLELQKDNPKLDNEQSQFESASAGRAKMGAHNPTALVRMQLVGANRDPRVVASEELPGRSNYFVGNDPAKWRTDVPNYSRLRYQDIYRGVDLVYYGNQRQLEYDFVLAPGTDPQVITLAVNVTPGTRRSALRIAENGDLVLDTGSGEVRFRRPIVYQMDGELAEARHVLDAGYVLKGTRQIGFRVRDFDISKPLIIDPVLSYSTYLGGSGMDVGQAIAVDASGDAYVTGYTTSTDFPSTTTARPASTGYHAFVTKLNPAGNTRMYSTYLGGTGSDLAYGIAVDALGNAYVTGDTTSLDFPTMNALRSANAGGQDAFVAKLNPTGSGLVYSTYLGGSGFDYATGIALDGSANAYVTGFTYSADFPTTATAFHPSFTGASDAFVTKLNTTGSALMYSTYLGGSDYDLAYGIAVDSSGNAYVTGYTASLDFPTVNPVRPQKTGYYNAFVSELNSAGTGLVYSTYLGGSGFDIGYAIAVDSSGAAYVTGYTFSTDFPTVNPIQAANAGVYNAFVTKVNFKGSGFAYSTYLGGNLYDFGTGIAVDSSANAYVTGFTCSSNFPVQQALQSSNAGCYDAFVTKLDAAGKNLAYSTYLGGSSYDFGQGIAVDKAGSAYVTGYTYSTNFPTASALQAASGGGADAFVAKIATAVLAPSVTLAPPNLTFSETELGTTSAPQTVVLTNSGTATLQISGLTVYGNFASDQCGSSLAAGANCAMHVTFKPQVLGKQTGAVNITANAPGDPFSVPLSGMGVDRTPPKLTMSVSRSVLWPPNGKMVPVTVSGWITDSGSGVNGSTVSYKVSDEYRMVQPHGSMVLGSTGSYSCTIWLQASRRGDDRDGREYQITVKAADRAGNWASISAAVTVPHDQGAHAGGASLTKPGPDTNPSAAARHGKARGRDR